MSLRRVSCCIIDRTRIKSGVAYPIEEERGAVTVRSCLLNKDSRIEAQILWFQDGSPLDLSISSRSLQQQNQTLAFNRLETIVDQGLFTCRVTSIAGDDTRTYNITIVEVPRKPKVRAVLATIKRAINVTWTEPYNGNKRITSYNIRYKVNGM